MARPLTASCDELLPWLQEKGIVLKTKVAKPGSWGYSQLAYCRSGPGVVVYTARRFHLDGVLQELKILKVLAAEPCKHVQLPVSWRAWGAPNPMTAFAVTAPLATFKELLSEQRVDVALAALAAKHVAKALLHLHQRKLVHADLHDECIWLTCCEGKMVVKVTHFSAAAVIARPKNQGAAEPSETLAARELSSAAEPFPGLPATKKHKQAQPLLMSTHGKHNAPETWPESCSGGMVYDEAVDIWAFGWLFRP
jgi:hypothetical protein